MLQHRILVGIILEIIISIIHNNYIRRTELIMYMLYKQAVNSIHYYFGCLKMINEKSILCICTLSETNNLFVSRRAHVI